MSLGSLVNISSIFVAVFFKIGVRKTVFLLWSISFVTTNPQFCPCLTVPDGKIVVVQMGIVACQKTRCHDRFDSRETCNTTQTTHSSG